MKMIYDDQWWWIIFVVCLLNLLLTQHISVGTLQNAARPSVFEIWFANLLLATAACTFETSVPKSKPLWCLYGFDLQMCFVPERHAILVDRYRTAAWPAYVSTEPEHKTIEKTAFGAVPTSHTCMSLLWRSHKQPASFHNGVGCLISKLSWLLTMYMFWFVSLSVNIWFPSW